MRDSNSLQTMTQQNSGINSRRTECRCAELMTSVARRREAARDWLRRSSHLQPPPLQPPQPRRCLATVTRWWRPQRECRVPAPKKVARCCHVVQTDTTVVVLSTLRAMRIRAGGLAQSACLLAVKTHTRWLLVIIVIVILIIIIQSAVIMARPLREFTRFIR